MLVAIAFEDTSSTTANASAGEQMNVSYSLVVVVVAATQTAAVRVGEKIRHLSMF